jgi:hypothetical protein
MHTGLNSAVHYDCAAGNPEKKRGWLPEEVPEVDVDVFND